MSEVVRPVSSLIVNQRDYLQVKKLGSGATSSVYLVRSRAGERFAMKVVKCNSVNIEEQRALLREIEVMARAVHPALLRLVGYSLPQPRDSSAVILTEYMPRGSLANLLEQQARGEAPPDWNPTRRLCVILGIAGGMRYLHDHKILHRDLKSANILLGQQLDPRIGDFGLSRIADPQNRDALILTSQIGSPLYMAPELFSGSTTYGPEIDVYAFGILTFEVLTGTTPFSDIGNAIALGMHICQGVRPPIPESVPAAFARLIQRCWANDRSSRPSFDSIVDLLRGDEFLLPGCDAAEVERYRATVFVAPSGDAEKTEEDSFGADLAAQQQEVIDLRDGFLAEMGELRQEIQALQEENTRLRETCDSLRQEATRFRDQLARHQGKFRDYRADFSQTRTHFDLLYKNLQAHRDSLTPFTGKKRRIKAEYEDLARRAAELLDGAAPAPDAPETLTAAAVTGTSREAADQQNIGKIADAGWQGTWNSAPSDAAWICIDLGPDKTATLTGYTLKAGAGGNRLKSWVVEGTNDTAESWYIIDRVVDDTQLSDADTATYSCKAKKPAFRFFRITQAGPSHAGCNTGFSLSNIELLGKCAS
jgi:serine/threonine protein kinase